jgi:hypothetical protein
VNSGKAGEVPALASVAVSVGEAEEGAIFGPADPGELSQPVPFEMWAWTSWDMGLVFMGWQYFWKPTKEGDNTWRRTLSLSLALYIEIHVF